MRGDLAIRGLFERGTTAIIDVRVTDLDSDSYRTQDPKSVLRTQEREKINKYQASCAARRESFHPFVVSIDGMLAPQATLLLQRLASANADKTQYSYSQVMHYIKTRLSIALVKATHLCIRGSRKPKPFGVRTGPLFVPPDPTEPSPEFRLFFS